MTNIDFFFYFNLSDYTLTLSIPDQEIPPTKEV